MPDPRSVPFDCLIVLSPASTFWQSTNRVTPIGDQPQMFVDLVIVFLDLNARKTHNVCFLWCTFLRPAASGTAEKSDSSLCDINVYLYTFRFVQHVSCMHIGGAGRRYFLDPYFVDFVDCSGTYLWPTSKTRVNLMLERSMVRRQLTRVS